MKRIILLIVLIVSTSLVWAEDVKITVDRIWEGEYCAFTSLIEYNGHVLCSFREADQHHANDSIPSTLGRARIISSRNGKNWKSVALLTKTGVDLRDPKFSVMPDGRLMVIMGGSVYQGKKLVNMYPHVSFSSDGVHFSNPIPVVLDSTINKGYEWIWRVTWHNGVGYGVIYGSDYALVKTIDGIHFSLVTRLDVPNNPGETSLSFLSDGTMLLMSRREGGDKKGIWGRSKAPYTDWEWTDMNILLGGPDFLVMPDDSTTIVGTRSLYASEKTMMFKGLTDGKFEEVCILPSGGDDNSYTGMIIRGKYLWVSYYSRHATEKASIYLARIPMSYFLSPRTNKYYLMKW